MARSKITYLSFMLLTYSGLAFAQPHQHDGERGGLREFFHNEDGSKPTPEQIEQKKKEFREEKEKLSKMTPDEKIAFIEQRRNERLQKMEEKFKSMTDKDKIEFVNKRYAKMKEKMEEKWKGMSKEEKIAFVEEKINKHGERGHRKFRKEGKD